MINQYIELINNNVYCFIYYDIKYLIIIFIIKHI